MASRLPRHILRSFSLRTLFHGSRNPNILSQSRRSSTFKTASGRVLHITKTPIPTATASSCDCDIHFPDGLQIDRERPLINTVAAYNQHIVIATGKNDWASKIENEEGGVGKMARSLKNMTKVKGEWFDPNYSTLISNSSFAPNAGPSSPQPPAASSTAPSTTAPSSQPSTSLTLFPHFLHFPSINLSTAHYTHLISAYLGDQSRPPSQPQYPAPSGFIPPHPLTRPTILICSHATRDARCGVLGPLVYDEFLKHTSPDSIDVDVGMISHVGGHAFAGNVIVYIPPDHPIPSPSGRGGAEAEEGEEATISPLSGTGIWYGRVEPRHVSLIMEETVRKGRILGDLWRGGLDTAHTGGDAGDWRGRTAGARVVRVPAGVVVARDVEVVEGEEETASEGRYTINTERRLELMGAKARERWVEQRWRR